jgi:hypothetical protein
MTYELTTEQKRMLTEKVLGECWHGWNLEDGHNYSWICCKCNAHADSPIYHRTFTAPDDIYMLKENLNMRGAWCNFWAYCWNIWNDSIDPRYAEDGDFSYWLSHGVDELGNPRFPWLVEKFMEEK